MIERLTALGLDDKEQRFYLATLQLGAAPVADVAARAGVSRTNGYDLFKRLEQRGLLSQTSASGGVRKIIAEDPAVLIRDWERKRVMLNELVPELRSIYNGSTTRPRTRLYEGSEGIERALWETLECRSKELYAILSMHELREVPGLQWMEGFIAERIRKEIELKVLRSPSRETDDIWPTEAYREVRFAPRGIDLSMSMYINDDTVTYVSSKEENYALIIESRELSTLNRTFFNSIWSISDPVAPVP